MKQVLIILLFALGYALRCGADDREFAKKQITHKNVGEKPDGWRLNSLPFKEWLDAVTFPDCQLLHSSETEEFYFAVFRSKGHLIFWNADRNSRYQSSNIGITAEGRSALAEGKASEWTILETTVEFVSGAVRGQLFGQELGSAFVIKSGLDSNVTIHYSVGAANEPARRKVFEQTVPWSK